MHSLLRDVQGAWQAAPTSGIFGPVRAAVPRFIRRWNKSLSKADLELAKNAKNRYDIIYENTAEARGEKEEAAMRSEQLKTAIRRNGKRPSTGRIFPRG